MAKHVARQVEQLKQKILYVGSMVEGALAQAVLALISRDDAIARTVIDEDDDIDRLEVDVEEDCLKVLALYQPVAVDLRFVVAVLKINNDLERMGDLAKNIAKKTIYLARHEPLDLPIDFRGMAAQAQSMVRASLDALVNGDVQLAARVRHDDDELDTMRSRIHDVVRSEIRKQPDRVEYLLKLYSVAKHLERVGDMATNIAEEVIYMVEGEIVRHQHDDD